MTEKPDPLNSHLKVNTNPPTSENTSNPLTFKVGQILAETYRLEKLLGQGGMGQVWLATHLLFNEPRAIKFILQTYSATPAIRERFISSEARYNLRLQHSNIVRVYELGQYQAIPYIVMEYVNSGSSGSDLKSWLLVRGKLTPRQAGELLFQLAAGLYTAHQQGLVHRDLKPSNIMMTEKGEAKIGDFGLIKDLATDLELTATGYSLGTPTYLAPEQAEGQADTRSDLYSLGIIIYEMLTGSPPFSGNAITILKKHAFTTPIAPDQLDPSISSEVGAVIMKALAKKPEERYANVLELAAAYQAALNNSPELATIPLPITPKTTINTFKQILVSPPSQVLCRKLIGREIQLKLLREGIAEVANGKGHIFLLAGEAGIGKSRLASEARQYAMTKGWQICQANCLEMSQSLPYAPLIELVTPYLNSISATEAYNILGSNVADLIKILPNIAARFSTLKAVPAIDPREEKQRLFQAFYQIFSHLASQQPLLLLIEDLHWSDANTLEGLTYLARHLITLPIMLLFSCRKEELSSVQKKFVGWLERERLLTELKLERFNSEQVESMIWAIFNPQSPLDRKLLSDICNLTEGNPFFIEEILKVLVGQDTEFLSRPASTTDLAHQLHIPLTIQETVERHTENISEAALELLQLAAVIGHRFDFGLLERITGRTEAEIIKNIKELIAAQLVVEAPGDEFAFRHALTRQALYSKLLYRERKMLHAKIAKVLEANYPDTRTAELAYHYYQVEDWLKALFYSRQAGDKAQALYAPQVAIEHYTRALEAGKQTKKAVDPTIWLSRGSAYESTGDFDCARTDYEVALKEAQITQHLPTQIAALLALGGLWSARNYLKTDECYRETLALARNFKDQALLASCINSLGNWHLNQDEPDKALEYHREALNIFSQLDNKAGLANTYDLMGISSIMNSQMDQGVEFLLNAIHLFTELNDQPRQASSRITLALACGSYHAPTLYHSYNEFATRLGNGELGIVEVQALEWRSGQAYGFFIISLVRGFYGQYPQALAAATESYRIAEEIQHLQWRTAASFSLGVIYLDLLNFEVAEEYLSLSLALALECHSLYWRENAASYLALAFLRQNKIVQAG